MEYSDNYIVGLLQKIQELEDERINLLIENAALVRELDYWKNENH